MSREITNNEDVIDSRDIIERIEVLEGDLSGEELPENADELRAELEPLQKLAEQCENIGDWHWGEALIRDDYFEEYAQQLAEDCGMIDRNLSWPLSCIDWEQAAKELQVDYVNVTFDGVDYWIRG